MGVFVVIEFTLVRIHVGLEKDLTTEEYFARVNR